MLTYVVFVFNDYTYDITELKTDGETVIEVAAHLSALCNQMCADLGKVSGKYKLFQTKEEVDNYLDELYDEYFNFFDSFYVYMINNHDKQRYWIEENINTEKFKTNWVDYLKTTDLDKELKFNCIKLFNCNDNIHVYTDKHIATIGYIDLYFHILNEQEKAEIRRLKDVINKYGQYLVMQILPKIAMSLENEIQYNTQIEDNIDDSDVDYDYYLDCVELDKLVPEK